MTKKFFVSLLKIYRNLSIRNKILITSIIIFTIPLISFAVFSYSLIYNIIVQESIKQSSMNIHLLSQDLNTFTQDTENFIKLLSFDKQLQSQIIDLKKPGLEDTDPLEFNLTKRSLNEQLITVCYEYKRIRSAAIVSNGEVITSTGSFSDQSILNTLDFNTINQAYKNRQPVWTDINKLIYQNDSSINVFSVVKSINDPVTSEAIALLIFFIDENDISSMYKSGMNDVYIVNSKGIVVSSSNKQYFLTAFDTPYGKIDLSQTGNNVIDLNGTKSLVSITYFKKMDWRIVGIVPLNVFASGIHKIARFIIIMGIICFVISLLLSYLLSYFLSSPLKNLVRAMNAVDSGNLDIMVASKSRDEIGLLGLGFNNLMVRVNKLLNEVYIEQKKQRDFEFRLIQFQIKPHFLYNTLETVISLIRLGLHTKAIEAASSMAGYYRISLSKGRDIITLEEEIKIIENYLAIQKIRYTDYMEYEIDIAKEAIRYNIPKLIIQPLVENSIYHGIKQLNRKGLIRIKGYIEKNNIIISVFDNGKGIPENHIHSILKNERKAENTTGSFGLANVDSRIKLLFGNEYGLSIESNYEAYTIVSFKIPLITEDGGIQV